MIGEKDKMSNLNLIFKSIKEDIEKEKDNFNIEDFYRENEKRREKIENLKKTNKVTIFSDDTIDR